MFRIVLVLLAFYTASLSCIPCQDEALGGGHSDVAGLTEMDADQQKTADIDLCSPFCSCTCCAGISLQHHSTYLPEKRSFSTFEDITFMYLPGCQGSDPTSIWQPPRA